MKAPRWPEGKGHHKQYFHEEGEGRKSNAVSTRAAAKREAVFHERKPQGKPDRGKEALKLLRGGVHLRAQAELPGKGGHLHELQEEGPLRSHLPQWKAFKRERASCIRISNTGIWSNIRFR
jgi:hypothetical protein